MMTAMPCREDELFTCDRPDTSSSNPGLIDGVASVSQLKNAQSYSERLSAVSHFTSAIVHQINNSLTPIICYAQLIGETPGTRLHQRHAGRILDAANRAREIMDGLMTYAGDQPCYSHAIDLNQLVRGQVLPVASDLLQFPRERVRLDFDEELPILEGDPHQLTNLLLHLLRNALEASDPDDHAEIVIRTRCGQPGGVVLEVEDHGSGIAPRHLPKVLLPFFTTRGDENRGLGLALVHSIVEAHHAELEIDSTPGAGTTIRIIFPG